MRRASHRLIAALALACFAAAFALTPSEVRSRLTFARAAELEPPAPAPPPGVAVEEPVRDPFAARAPDEQPEPARTAAPARPLPARSLVTAVRVIAIAVGDRPAALIADGGEPHLIAPGDPVAGSTVRAIDDRGVRLADGRLLRMPATNERP